jgi:hypothetical protein
MKGGPLVSTNKLKREKYNLDKNRKMRPKYNSAHAALVRRRKN